MRIIGAILVLLHFLAIPAQAEDTQPAKALIEKGTARIVDAPPARDPWPAFRKEPIAPHLKGLWAMPDCIRAEKIYVLSSHHIMKIWPDLYYIGPVRALHEEDKVDGDRLAHVQSYDYSLLLRLTNDGLFKVTEAEIQPGQPLETKWGSQQETLSEEYTRCAKLFGSELPIGQEEVNTPYILDMIALSCRSVDKKNFNKELICQRKIFDVADYNQDGLLNENELARAYRQVVFMSSASTRLCNQASFYNAATAKDAANFAQFFLTLAGAENKKGVDFDTVRSLLSDRTKHTGRLYTALETALGLRVLMPFLPDPHESRACTPFRPERMQTLGTIEAAPITREQIERTQAP
jgi:hypothetical protein